MALLFDVITEVTEDTYISKKYNYQQQTDIQNTSIIAPNISPQYSINHAPVLQFNSPSGSIGGATTTQTPVVSPNVSAIPTQSAEQLSSMEDAADMGDILGGGNGLQNILLIGAVAIVAIIFIPKLLKSKKSKKLI